jgi:endonuclease YncB( thermonuclease family)
LLKYNVYVQDIFVAEELVKQGYATWEWNPAEDQQMNMGAQLGQVPTDNTEAASSGTKSNTVVEGQDVIESGDYKEAKSEAQISGIRLPECCSDEYDSDDGLEMG